MAIKINRLSILVFIFTFSSLGFGKNYYISSKGKGRKASKSRPAKDLGNIISKIKAGDTIYIAGGKYRGKGDNGHYKIEVPVKIIGGYDENFEIRDPWGKYKTIFTGRNQSDNFDARARLLFELHLRYTSNKKSSENQILVDGIIVDNSERNRYSSDNNMIIRRASPSQKKHQTPKTAGIKVTSAKFVDVTIKNCVVTNVGSAMGAIRVAGNKNNKIKIDNNLIVNNTGNGIYASTVFHINKRDITKKELATLPAFEVSNNTVLFSWQFGPVDRFGGKAFKVDANLAVKVSNNVFGFSDFFGVDNIRKARFLELTDNLIIANQKGDYREFNTIMSLKELEDEAELLSEDSTGNISKKIDLVLSKSWAKIYIFRKNIQKKGKNENSSNSSFADIKKMLGFSKKVKRVARNIKIWLHKMELKDAVNTGAKKYYGKYGCSKPWGRYII